ncbi:hypothetical protein BJP41_10700 (plasmid) [Candidatus Williamhamiltonella defendens]|uniref:Transposase Synechocystis PCC 6803 domain-containing protein n=1 Tax=Candidatus Williamhamiltonella defendens TaxID=138072 RepID=A0A2D3T552_9ENTR|nr:IS630 transposase-related protein [Candidatus Hamiltonella defensa]ATW30925.1 hypothetical protein BJP41_10700 [Candidatus Hamiltonella defensa]
MSYSVDFRQKVLSIREKEGLSIRATAKRFHVGTDTLRRWLKRIEPKPSGPRRGKMDKEAFIKDVAEYPDSYQRERAARFWVCPKAIWQALKRWGLTYKKNSASSQGKRRGTTGVPGKNRGVSKAG